MRFLFFSLLFGLISTLYVIYLVCSVVFSFLKYIINVLFNIKNIFSFLGNKPASKQIAKIGDKIRWTMNDNCSIWSGKVFESVVMMVDLEEKHYGVYAEYGQDLIPFECAVIVKPNNRIKCGEKDEQGFYETFVDEKKTNTKIILFNKEELIKAYKKLRGED